MYCFYENIKLKSSSICGFQMGDIVPEAKRVVGAEGGGGRSSTMKIVKEMPE
jgi:hypothetical protein